MHVLRILTRANLGGPARQVRALTPRFSELGTRQTIVVGSLAPGETALEPRAEPGTRILNLSDVVRGFAPRRDARAHRALLDIVRDERPDVIHSHAAKAGYLAARLARDTGIPLVHTYHGHVLRDYFGRLRTALYRRVERRLCRVRDVVTCVSESCGRELEELGVLEPSRWRTVLPAVASALSPDVDLSTAKAKARRELGFDERPAIAWCGRFEAVKDPSLAVEVFEELLRRVSPDLQICFFGTGRLQYVARKLAEERGPRIGWRDADARYPRLVSAFDCVLSTSRREGMPLSAIEALLARVPVVAPRVPGFTDLAGDGVRLTQRTMSALADGVEDVLADPDRAGPGPARMQELREAHAPARIAEQYLAIYRELVDSRG